MRRRTPETSAAKTGGDLPLMIALIAAMATASLATILRDTLLPAPGADLAPRLAGPETSLGLDLLLAIPAILVLCRAALSKPFALRWSWSLLPLAALCVWMIGSTWWAADKFAALVAACHWTAAFSLAWAASQLVCDWRRLRIVAAAAVGLLALYVIQAGNYRLVSVPELQKHWKENSASILRQRNIDPRSDPFLAQQFEKKVMAGELMGFTTSANSFGAILVMLGIVTAGVMIQLASDKNTPGASVAGVVLALGLVVTVLTYSKTAMVTPFLAAAILLLIWRCRHGLARRAKGLYWAGVALIGLMSAAVVGHGLFHGTLPTKSLAFRWDYWVGAGRLFFSSHKLAWLGTGWSNFGSYYLQFRLPRAPEEIKDTHNFVVKFFVELGVVGGVLLLGWMLRLWWELTRPTFGVEDAKPQALSMTSSTSLAVSRGQKPMVFFSCVCVVLAALTIFLGPDWTQTIGYVLFDSCTRLVYAAIFLIAAVLTSVRSVNDPVADDRPAPWILYGLLVGVGMFLIHNFVDFSLSEPGPLAIFALLVGSVLGIRQAARPRAESAGAAGRTMCIGAMIAGLAAFAALAAGVWGPTLRAEQSAADGDRQMHEGGYAAALRNYSTAADVQPLNADYFYRAFWAAYYQNLPQTRSLLDQAIAANPRQVRYYLDRARYMETTETTLEGMRQDYLRAIGMDPNSVDDHREYASALQARGGPRCRGEARQQFQEALAANDRLPPNESRRLSPAAVKDIRHQIDLLSH